MGDCYDGFHSFLKIVLPRREYNSNLGFRFVSQKYSGVQGDYRLTIKEAKASYKKALHEHLNEYKKKHPNAILDVKEVNKRLRSAEVPFSKIYFLGVKIPKIYFGEIYPNAGSEGFSIGKFL